MNEVAFGVFDWIDRSSTSLHQLYEDRLQLLEAADAANFAVAQAAHSVWYHSITKLWHDHADHSVDGLFAWDTAIQNETILIGSPPRVREQVSRLVDETGCNYVICSFAWGTLSHQQSLLSLFAQEVMPAFTLTT